MNDKSYYVVQRCSCFNCILYLYNVVLYILLPINKHLGSEIGNSTLKEGSEKEQKKNAEVDSGKDGSPLIRSEDDGNTCQDQQSETADNKQAIEGGY